MLLFRIAPLYYQFPNCQSQGSALLFRIAPSKILTSSNPPVASQGLVFVPFNQSKPFLPRVLLGQIALDGLKTSTYRSYRSPYWTPVISLTVWVCYTWSRGSPYGRASCACTVLTRITSWLIQLNTISKWKYVTTWMVTTQNLDLQNSENNSELHTSDWCR